MVFSTFFNFSPQFGMKKGKKAKNVKICLKLCQNFQIFLCHSSLGCFHTTEMLHLLAHCLGTFEKLIINLNFFLLILFWSVWRLWVATKVFATTRRDHLLPPLKLTFTNLIIFWKVESYQSFILGFVHTSWWKV